MDRLENCYNIIQKEIEDDIEPFESVALVDQYRQYWKPDKIKIMLLAESHVFTTDEDRKIEIPLIDDLPGYPRFYAKFVYCLGYGERYIIKNDSHPKRDGTPQYWKIFYSCNNYVDKDEDFKPILKKTSDDERILKKINLLRNLKQRGIWLVDSSIIGVYDRSKKHRQMNEIIKISWREYIKYVVQEANPRYVICIGKRVHKVLSRELNELLGDRYSVIPQPQAHLTSKEHMLNWKKYFTICKEYTKLIEY